jgi:hypothetical protein
MNQLSLCEAILASRSARCASKQQIPPGLIGGYRGLKEAPPESKTLVVKGIERLAPCTRLQLLDFSKRLFLSASRLARAAQISARLSSTS